MGWFGDFSERLRSIGDSVRHKAHELEGNVLSNRIAETANRIAQNAQQGYSTAQYDGSNDVSVGVEFDGNDATVIASGNAAPFIEFGTGVHYNGGGRPHSVPDWVSPIGTYGSGKGKRDSWYYKGDPGTDGELATGKGGKLRPVVKTHGNPAQFPLTYAYEAERKQFLRHIKNEMRLKK